MLLNITGDCMNYYKKRKEKWQNEINEGKKRYHENTGLEYDYYGEVSRRESMKAPKEKIFSINNLVKIILIIIIILIKLQNKFNIF